MINNIQLIKPLLDFSLNQTYQILILRRKKDFDKKENKEDVKIIKDYYIRSISDLEEKYEEIIGLSEFFKARVYILLNARNEEKVGVKMLSVLSDLMNTDSNKFKNIFRSTFTILPKIGEKRFIIDVDSNDKDLYNEIYKTLFYCEPKGNKCITNIPTPNGYYIVCKPFNIKTFMSNQHVYYQCGIKKDNPTILYYPNSLKNDEIKNN